MAADTTTFDSCTDAGGRVVAAEADYGQRTLVQTTYAGGQPTIRYNPGVLPRLTPAARLFFYAHECARHALGAAGKPLTATRAQQADCVGLATMLTADLVTRDQLDGLQGQLNFSESEWELLPGPPRSFNLAACRPSGGLRLPSPETPSVQQGTWNACARACGDRLWKCQKGCRGAACETGCLDSHRQCEAACGSQ
ncbi:MAG TPA: hypothetical protein VFF82_04670 [Rhodocyclaceae bacterium]|nr:hypothetical protein [Rhodocyclaceae bacterium]